MTPWLWICRTAAWRQRRLEKACRPALGDLGQEPLAARASSCSDDEEALQQQTLRRSPAGLRSHASARGQQPHDDRLKTVAWDTHCISSMLAGAPLCLRLPSCSASRRPFVGSASLRDISSTWLPIRQNASETRPGCKFCLLRSGCCPDLGQEGVARLPQLTYTYEGMMDTQALYCCD